MPPRKKPVTEGVAEKKPAAPRAKKKEPSAVTKSPAPGRSKTQAPPKEAPAGGRSLVIVESPAKAKTIEKYLGAGFKVLASYGHVRDLPPKGKLKGEDVVGIDIKGGWVPRYVVVDRGGKGGGGEVSHGGRHPCRVAEGSRQVEHGLSGDRSGP